MRRSLLKRITESIGLYSESVPGVTFIELNGDDCIVVENYEFVNSYEPSLINIETSYGAAILNGEALTMSYLHRNRIVIRGKVNALQIIREENK